MKRRDEGLSLLEVLMALLVLGIVLSFSLTGLLSNVSLNNKSEVKSGAAIAVQRVLDATRVVEPRTLPTGGSSLGKDVTVGGRVFKVFTDYCVVTEYCTESARSVRVRAQIGSGPTLVSTDTVFTSLNSTLGSIAGVGK
ncbi:type IV pilus modification PilV family protein [Deinococcus sp.]|uniref:type IV pilus modification PilV family protein n=1 Tax=Deinococcus sp. TaxID=47478 RepID=UPI003B5BF0E7